MLREGLHVTTEVNIAGAQILLPRDSGQISLPVLALAHRRDSGARMAKARDLKA